MESLSKETGDFVSDHLFATLRHQFEKGTSRAKAVKLAKSLFHKRQAVGRMYDYLDDAARAAMYEFVEAEDVLEEEVEQLGKIAQTYQAKTEKALTKTQLDDLLGDSSLGAKSVEEVVAGLVKGSLQSVIKKARISIDDIRDNAQAFNDKSAEEIAHALEEVGYDVNIQKSTRPSSRPKIIKVNNTSTERNIAQVQVSPGGGRHGDNPYVKISTTD